MLGGFSRFGVWREIAIAFSILIAIDGARGALVQTVRDSPILWPVIYAPTALGGLLVLGMLWHLSNPGWLVQLRRKGALA